MPHRSRPGRLAAGVGSVVAVTMLCVSALRWSIVEVAGRSMLPTLRPGDRLVTTPAIRRLLRSGTLVVVEDPRQAGHLVVKRLARTTGDRAVVIGDSETDSTDSRHWGPVPIGTIHRIVLCRWPHVRSVLIGPAAGRHLADHAWVALRSGRR